MKIPSFSILKRKNKLCDRSSVSEYERFGNIWARGIICAALCFVSGVLYVCVDYYQSFVAPTLPPTPPSSISNFNESRMQETAEYYTNRAQEFYTLKSEKGRAPVYVPPLVVETEPEPTPDVSETSPTTPPPESDIRLE